MYGELDGTFPNHPADPIQAENLKDLQRAVLDLNADIGLAFDGDADRVFLVDDKGVPVSGSTTTAIVAAGILDRHPGETVVHNLICSKALPEVIREHGGTPVRTRVGHSFIKQVMAETGAIFGGEHSAHYYFRDNWRADSGSIAALLVLEQLGRAGIPLSELRKPFERYVQSGEINSRVDDPLAIIEAVAAEFSACSQDRLDGLTVDCGEWWFNLRPSNTEPLAALESRSARRGAVRSAHPRGAGAHPRRLTRSPADVGLARPLVCAAWRSTRNFSRSLRARRTRARCCTSRTNSRCTTRACTGAIACSRATFPICSSTTPRPSTTRKTRG